MLTYATTVSTQFFIWSEGLFGCHKLYLKTEEKVYNITCNNGNYIHIGKYAGMLKIGKYKKKYLAICVPGNTIYKIVCDEAMIGKEVMSRSGTLTPVHTLNPWRCGNLSFFCHTNFWCHGCSIAMHAEWLQTVAHWSQDLCHFVTLDPTMMVPEISGCHLFRWFLATV